jgi:hypothetical protein
VVEKIAKERTELHAARRQKAEEKERNSSLKFDHNDAREFVSSFRKSKLRVSPCVCALAHAAKYIYTHIHRYVCRS